MHLHLGAIGEVDHRPENNLVAGLDPIAKFNLRSKVACNRDIMEMEDAIFDHGHTTATRTPSLLKTTAWAGTINDGVLRGMCNSTVKYVSGRSSPSG